MEINYKAFKLAIAKKNYEDAFYILFQMIDNRDPDAIKADRKWTNVVRSNADNKTIIKIEKKFKSRPKLERTKIELKYENLE